MRSLWRTLVDAVTVEERVASAQPSGPCRACRDWVAPEALTEKVVPSVRAIEWARSKQLGRCVSPKRTGENSGDTKRFTAAGQGCPMFRGH